MVLPRYNEPCDCGSRLFVPIDSYTLQDGEDTWEDGNVHKDRVGHKCVECGNVVLTREIPSEHANDPDLNLPDAADRDMVQE